MRSFKIPVVPQTTSRSIRFPNTLIDEVEDILKGSQSSFSSFVIAATQYAVDELKCDQLPPK